MNREIVRMNLTAAEPRTVDLIKELAGEVMADVRGEHDGLARDEARELLEIIADVEASR